MYTKYIPSSGPPGTAFYRLPRQPRLSVLSVIRPTLLIFPLSFTFTFTSLYNKFIFHLTRGMFTASARSRLSTLSRQRLPPNSLLTRSVSPLVNDSGFTVECNEISWNQSIDSHIDSHNGPPTNGIFRP